jgi:hypothetical protein
MLKMIKRKIEKKSLDCRMGFLVDGLACCSRAVASLYGIKIIGKSKKTLDSGLWYGHYIMNVDTNQLLQQL